MSLLRADAVSVVLGGRTIVRDVDFVLDPGELVAILGPNGSGKTTLARALAATVPRRAARLELGGQAIDQLSRREIARRLAVVPQDTHVPFGFTVDEMVAMGRAPHLDAFGREGDSDRERIAHALAAQGIAELAARTYPTLSGGEKQRVLLARAEVQSAPAMLLDEPTSQMDLGHRLRALAWLRAWIAERPGRGVAWITHDLNLAARFADRVHLLHEGQTLIVGPPRTVLTPTHIRTAYQLEVEISETTRGFPQITPLHPTPP